MTGSISCYWLEFGVDHGPAPEQTQNTNCEFLLKPDIQDQSNNYKNKVDAHYFVNYAKRRFKTAWFFQTETAEIELSGF